MLNVMNLFALLGMVGLMTVTVRAMFPYQNTSLLQILLSILIGAVMAKNEYGAFDF